MAKSRNTCVDLYGKPYYSQTGEYIEKTKNTHIKLCGYEWSSQCPDVKDRTARTNELRYGGKSPMSSAEVIEKSRMTCIDRYGVCHPLQRLDIMEKQRTSYAKTCSEKYALYGGHPSKDPAIKKKISDTVKSDECRLRTAATTKERYGVEFSSQCREIRLKQQRRYIAIRMKTTGAVFPVEYLNAYPTLNIDEYTELKFDSGPEIAFYIWHYDHKIEFEYQPKSEFKYEYDGKTHIYIADFRVGDIYYEIKGNHMIDNDGHWICPWDRSRDGVYEAKYRCAIANGVVVLLNDNYKKYVQYVNEKYGKDYIKSFRNFPSSMSK